MSRTISKVSLALQGGGAHGAFTWGVADRLLEENRFEITGITGTSAGAINAVAIADGYLSGGAEQARAKLHEMWSAIGENARLSPFKRTTLNTWLGNWSLDNSPGYQLFDFLSRYMSPYDFNPLGINPLRQILSELIDFERIRENGNLRLFVTATRVADGTVKVFRNDELNVEAVLASAGLPFLFPAVEIEGEEYWDGGYTGNPALFPYLYECAGDDIVLIQINPVRRAEMPRTAQTIANRVEEITFNASLLREMRAIEFITALIRRGVRLPGDFRPLRIHRIDGEKGLEQHSATSKINAERGFIQHLHQLGREAGDKWLQHGARLVGRRPRRMSDPVMALFPQAPPRRVTRLFRGRKAS